MNRGNRLCVSRNRPQAFTSLHLPNPDRLVEGAGDDEVGLRIKIDAENVIGVAFEDFQAVEGSTRFPNAEGAIVGGGADVVGVGGPCEVTYAGRVTVVAVNEGEIRGGGPENYGFVEGTGDQ